MTSLFRRAGLLLGLLAPAALMTATDARAQQQPQTVPVPQLYPRYGTGMPGDTTARDSAGLFFRLSQGEGAGPAYVAAAARGRRLSEEEVRLLLGRLRPLPVATLASDSFHFPAETLPAPRAGTTILTTFPPPDSGPPVPSGPAAPAALAVTRRAPEGEVRLGAEVTIAFSQPMVPLSSVTEVNAGPVPVRLTPQPPGRWRWIDVRTLRFEPEGRLPMATEFTVEVPPGTRSATGGTLAEGVRWTFATPAPRALGSWPNGSIAGLEPVIVVAFDQRVDPAAILRSVTLRGGGVAVPVRLATAAEIEADEEARVRVKTLEEGRWIAFRPVRALPTTQGVEAAIEPGAPSAEGPRRTADRQVWSFRTYGPFRVTDSRCGWGEGGCRPGQPFLIELTNPIDPRTLSPELVSVEPRIEGMRVSGSGNHVFIHGRTRPHTRYTVTLSPALKDRFGQALGTSRTLTFDVGAPVAQLWGGPTNVVVLDPLGSKTVPVFAHDHRRLRLRVHRVAPEDWQRFRTVSRPASGGPAPLPGRQAVDRVLTLDAPVGETREVPVDLSGVLQDGIGQVVVAVEAVEGPTEHEREQAVYLWVQGTRIGVMAFSDAEELVGWASSLVDGSPLEGAELTLLPGGAGRAAGPDGVARLPLPAGVHRDDRLLVVRRGSDVAILAPGMGNAGWASWVGQRREAPAAWYGFTDRNLYRPGEEVRFKGWVRQMRQTEEVGLSLVSGVETVEWTVYDPRRNQIKRGTSVLTALGGFDGAFTIPEGANLGYGTIEVRLPGREGGSAIGFQVQEFRRPEYEVSVTADPGPHVVGGHANVLAKASYFSGGGLPGAPVHWEVVASPGWYSPPGWDEWRFGITPQWWWWDRERSDDTRRESFEGITDGTGAHALRLDFDRAKPPRAHSVSANATVTDVNRQTWTSTASLLVHPGEVYVGLRTRLAWLERGDTLDLDVMAVDLDGKPAAGRPIEIRVTRTEWNQVQGEWKSRELQVGGCTFASGGSPLRCLVPTTEGGPHRVTATVTDAEGRPSVTEITLWVSGGDFRMPGQEGDQRQRTAELVPDREHYAPGDTAKVLVRLPFSPVRGVVTLRRNGVASAEEFSAEGVTHVLRIPLDAADIPNVHVQVDLVGAGDGRDERARGTDFATGTISLSVPPAIRELKVAAIPADSAMEPDQPATVEVEVLDAAGRPVQGAEVALVVVDESVLALTGYRITNPLALFYPTRDPGTGDVRLHPLVRVVAPELAPAPGTLVGRVVRAGDGEPVGGATVRVQGTQLTATTDAHGRFRIAGVRAGALRLLATHPQFGDAALEVTVGAGATPPLRLSLTGGEVREEDFALNGRAAGVQLEAVTVSAAGEDRARRGAIPPPPAAPPMPAPADAAVPPGPPAPIAVRENFKALAVFAPELRTDARGRASITFPLPSSLTRYRVTAVAVEGATRYGLGESAITARQPLMVRPSAPRFLNFGDRFELPVVVQNQTATPLEVDVAVRATGVTMTEPGERVTVAPGDRVEVRLAAEAVRAGIAHFQVAASSGRYADAAEISLPVYTPATAEAFATYGSLTEGAVTLPLDVPEDAIPSFGALEVSTSSTALQELTDALLFLVRYPYECSEQIASRVLAVAALHDVLAAFNAEELPPPEVLRDSVRRDVRRLAQLQNPDGGWGFWKRGEESWPYVSIHVAHAIQRARAEGYEVPDAMYQGALRYLRAAPRNFPAWYPENVRRALHAYALYVRDRMGDRVGAEAQRLLAQAPLEELGLEVAGWMLTALGDDPAYTAERDRLLRFVQNRATETPSTATFATSYTEGEYLLLHSNRRTDAIVLEGLLTAAPQSELATKTVRGLLGHRVRGRWDNTQENSWVLVAVQKYFRTFEAATPDFVARVWLGERFAGSHAFRGRSDDRHLVAVPMAVLQEQDPNSVTVGMEGTGRLYFRAGLRYAPRDLDLAPLNQGFAVERTYEPVDSASDVRRGEDGIWRVKAGARVRVTVTMTAPSRRLHVALADPLPAGFEPVNPDLLGAQPVPPEEGGGRPIPMGRRVDGFDRGLGGYGWWWGPWFQHQNLRDQRAEAFTTYLPAGVYTYSYVARATTPGLFIVPPTRAEEMYSPEVFGRAGTDRVIIEAPNE